MRPYSQSLVSLPETGDSSVPLSKVLDSLGREVLGDPPKYMLLTEEEWGRVLESGDIVKPYMDEVLQRDSNLYSGFVKDLFLKGMIFFTTRPREIIPPFFVAKKSGKLRLILDCRAVNRRFRKPPPIGMGMETCWSQVLLPPGHNLYLAQSNIQDYFYSLELPLSLKSMFCLLGLSVSTIQDWGIDELANFQGDYEGLLFPMLTVVPMGWSWAMWVAQRAH